MHHQVIEYKIAHILTKTPADVVEIIAQHLSSVNKYHISNIVNIKLTNIDILYINVFKHNHAAVLDDNNIMTLFYACGLYNNMELLSELIAINNFTVCECIRLLHAATYGLIIGDNDDYDLLEFIRDSNNMCFEQFINIYETIEPLANYEIDLPNKKYLQTNISDIKPNSIILNYL